MKYPRFGTTTSRTSLATRLSESPPSRPRAHARRHRARVRASRACRSPAGVARCARYRPAAHDSIRGRNALGSSTPRLHDVPMLSVSSRTTQLLCDLSKHYYSNRTTIVAIGTAILFARSIRSRRRQPDPTALIRYNWPRNGPRRRSYTTPRDTILSDRVPQRGV